MASTSAGSARRARALAVLQAAELRTGVRQAEIVQFAQPTRSEPQPTRSEPQRHSAPRLTCVGPLIQDSSLAADSCDDVVLLDGPGLPVQASLRRMVPGGAFAPGSVCSVLGSMSLLFALLAEASQSGNWVAFVGLPTAGLLAAAEAGLALERVALVPQPGLDAPKVIAALLAGLDAVVVGPDVALSPADRRRLAARARERGSVIFSTVEWAGAGLCFTAAAGEWQGAEAGAGWLQWHRLTVRRTGRGTAAQPRTFDVAVPLTYRPVAVTQQRPAAIGRPALRLAS